MFKVTQAQMKALARAGSGTFACVCAEDPSGAIYGTDTSTPARWPCEKFYLGRVGSGNIKYRIERVWNAISGAWENHAVVRSPGGVTTYWQLPYRLRNFAYWTIWGLTGDVLTDVRSITDQEAKKNRAYDWGREQGALAIECLDELSSTIGGKLVFADVEGVWNSSEWDRSIHLNRRILEGFFDAVREGGCPWGIYTSIFYFTTIFECTQLVAGICAQGKRNLYTLPDGTVLWAAGTNQRASSRLERPVRRSTQGQTQCTYDDEAAEKLADVFDSDNPQYHYGGQIPLIWQYWTYPDLNVTFEDPIQNFGV